MKSNKPTQMPLRIPSQLHKELKIAAKKEGLSLNQYALFILTRFGIDPKNLHEYEKSARLWEVLRFWDESQLITKALKKSRKEYDATTP